MGQNPSQVRANEDYSLVEELPIGSIVKHHKTENLHFLKEYSFTAQDAYQNALNMHSLKLANKNQHILNFMHFTTKSQNSFCSTFHKIVLIFEYIDYSLENQIATRLQENRPFTEKQMWSVLCSCVLAAVHLIHTEGRMHCGLTAKDIRLNSSGCVKLLNHQMIGISQSHDLNEGSPKTLAFTIVECLVLEKLTNQNNEYLASLIQNLECSRDMKQMLKMMVTHNMKFTELEEHLFKLVQDDQSMVSHSNTPILKPQQSPINSSYKCPKIYRNQIVQDNQHSNFKNPYCLEESQIDPEDYHQCQFRMQYHPEELETPDQTDNQDKKQNDLAEQTNNKGSPHKINSFFLRERKNEENLVKEVKKEYVQEHQQKNEINKNPIPHNPQNLQKPNQNNQQNIFTDPKLFSLIRNDLEEIKMRKSIGDLVRFQSESQESSSIYPTQYKTGSQSFTSLLDKKIITNCSSSHDFNKIEMIKEESNEQGQEAEISVEEKKIDNIMKDNEIGFKKSKPETKRVSENVELLKKQTRETVYQNILAHPTKKRDNPSQHEHQAFFNKYANQRHQQSRQEDKLISVNQKYTRGRYQGTKLNGKRHGYGTFFYSEGGKYVGNWFENKMHGKGILYYPNQKVAYQGNWENDQLSGSGVLYNEEVTPLRNPFDYRDFTDVEDYWTKYEGNFKEDNKDGKGKLYLVNGERLEATFHQDQVDGEGILYRGDGTFVKGKWRQNQLVGLF